MQTLLPVLTFHDVSDQRSVISIRPDVLRRGLDVLRENGFRTVRLADAVSLARRSEAFPDRSFVITFDDGFRTVYDAAFPLLREHGFSATIFLTVGAGGSSVASDRLAPHEDRPMLSWGEIREMQRAGIAFGAHSLTHPDLTRLPREQAEEQMLRSKAVIEDALGTSVDSFAYPDGRHNRRVRAIAEKHFACACSDKLGFITRCSDPYAVERIDAYYLRSDRFFRLMVTRWFPWYVRARGVPRVIRRMIGRSLGS